jgi:catecholate siderophore receptor
MHPKKIPAAAPLAAALTLSLSLPAFAADPALDADPHTPTDLDKVEVVGHRDGYAARRTTTATRTDTRLRDVPQSITVITRQLIRDQAMQNLADVVRYVPGVGMAQGEGNRDTPVFRGNSSTADMFIDGVRDDVQYFRDLYNIDSVEALKGPNAMIFGRGGSGGVLNRVSKQADWNTVRELSLQAGSWDKRRIVGDFGQPISNHAAFRVAGLVEDSESYRDDYSAERRGINPTLSLRRGENTLFALGYEHFEDERVADRGIPSSPVAFNGRRLPLDTDSSTFFGDPERSDVTVDVDAFSLRIDHTFDNGASLRNRTRIADYDKFYQNVFPGAVGADGTMVAISAYNNATQRQNLFNQTDLTFSASTGAIRHQLLAGTEFGRQETDNLRQTGFFGAPGSTTTSVSVPLANPRYTGPLEFRPSATDADNHGVARIAAVYLQDQIEFSPRWLAILGLRYDRFDVDFRNHRTGTTFASTDNLLSPRAGLVYKPTEPVSIYASYGVSYLPRAGDQLSSLSPSNQALDPEEFRNYELGAKWDIRPELAVTAAVYRLDRSNVLVSNPVDPSLSILVDGQRTKGVEIGLAGNITDAWSVAGGYAWQDGKITRDLSSSVKAGATLASLPEHSASLWNRYDFTPVWGVGLGVVHRGSMFASTSNAVTLKGYTRYDAAVYFTLNDNVELQLNVENLFDKKYFASANNDNNITPGSPLAVYLSATFKF